MVSVQIFRVAVSNSDGGGVCVRARARVSASQPGSQVPRTACWRWVYYCITLYMVLERILLGVLELPCCQVNANRLNAVATSFHERQLLPNTHITGRAAR